MRQATRSTSSVLALLLTTALAGAARADEYTVFTAEGTPRDPEGTVSVVIGSGNDDVTQKVSLPFRFAYFGRLYDEVSICSNGWAALGATTATTSSNPALPSTAAPDAVLAPLWDDLATGSGTVRTFTNGVAPGRVFVIDWHGVQSFDGEASDLRFQVVLAEGSGVVQFAYGSGGTWSGLSYTCGIEDPTGTVAFAPYGTGNDLSEQPDGLVLFQPRTVLVSGRLLRDRPVADESGLGNSTESGLAVEGATLRLVREDTDELAAVAVTGAGGVFLLVGPGLADTASLAVEVSAEGPAGRVVDASEVPYSFRFADGLDAEPVVDLGDVTLDAAVDGVDSRIRRALNIQQAIERGRRVALDAAAWAAAELDPGTPDTVPALDVTWVPGASSGGTRYTPTDGTTAARMSVAEGTANPDAYDDDVVLREYGQHVLATLSTVPGPLAGGRDFALETTAASAWVEGFGYFFAAGVQERARFVDTVSATTAVVDDLETPPPGARGATFPAAVAGSLWDLVDPANEPEDEHDGTLGPAPSTFVDVLAHIDRYLDSSDDVGGAEITVRSFFDIWHTGGTPEDDAIRAESARIFIHHRTLPDDDAEPNDRVDEATSTDGPGTSITGRSLSPANADVYRLVLPGATPQRLAFVVNQPTTSVDLLFELLDVDGAVLESATNEGVTGSGRQTVRINPVAALAPGTYHLRVSARGPETGGYTLSSYLPFLLATGDLPTWTADVPFKEDLVAAGGVAPYAFTTTTDAPGLAVTENGTRVTGVPTEAGDFVVDVRITDSAAPTNVVTASRPLRINPHPVLPGLFGIAAGRNTSRVLGSGGTDTEWTPLTQPANGMTLVGGSDLRLVGPSGGPAAFALRADARDAVGARLDDVTTFVVVTEDLLASDGAPVPANDAFGYFLDALEGSDLDVTLRFRGEGQTPTVSAVVDDEGTVLATAGEIDSFGRKVKLRGIRAQRTGRAHLLFTRGGFQGSVRVTAKVKPPRRVRGEAGIFDGSDVVDVPIDVLAGARVRVDLRRSPSPTDLEPTVVEVVRPDLNLLSLPTEQRRGKKRAILKFTAEQDGRHVLRLGSRGDTTGPLYYDVRIRTPRGARLVLD